ncbi:FGGY-family carbohydrate kinase [Pontibacter beigongshangensis]|uniref:FGGY-family carbohydrate kinase n=1 Tax=Pontibacter beigongshangensis TaxID=2574733 RepID=UPI00164F061F|nr:FGGY family carbohydrate kinase [Pontibacter beigongshangensis]
MVPCVAVFDIGKTNKKFLLFDQNYQIIKDEETSFEEITDDDGDSGEDLTALANWLRSTWQTLEADTNFDVKAVNFTTYGASLVHLNSQGEPITPLYNYLKPFPLGLEEQFYKAYGDKMLVAAQTSSPALGMLNSGLQLYWLKYGKPDVFREIAHSIHLPQYISFLFTGQMATDYTSLGCHTALWSFEKNSYHDWVRAEGLDKLFPPLRQHSEPTEITFRGKVIKAGLGLHDSSSALIPYLKQYQEPFLLLSTGTWGITLNPFAKKHLTIAELKQDCLQYLTYTGNPVKASRKFIGNAHEVQVKLLAEHYQKPADYFKQVAYNESLIENFGGSTSPDAANEVLVKDKIATAVQIELDLALYNSYEEAYHQLVVELAEQQIPSILLAAEGDTNNFSILLVDGGFSKNPIFMALLQKTFPNLRMKAGKSAQGTALGAALVMDAF